LLMIGLFMGYLLRDVFGPLIGPLWIAT